MAYQNISRPRFYIDLGQYLLAIGHDLGTLSDETRHLMSLNPTKQITNPSPHVFVPRIAPIKYCAFLGHNGNAAFYNDWYNPDDGTSNTIGSADGVEEVVNYVIPSVNDGVLPYHSGFTISTFSDSDNEIGVRGIVNRANTTGDVTVGAISIGNYYDMPHSPDLKLNLSYEYDGIKNIQSKGGATLSNAIYTKPADWGDEVAWQLGGNPNMRSGRRVWDLSFSFLSDTDVFPVNASTSYIPTLQDQDAAGYADGDLNANQDEFSSNILDGTDFFSQVWNPTLGGHLPMIVQLDNTNNNPDQFMLARFDQSSLEVTQTAPLLYSISLKIRESW